MYLPPTLLEFCDHDRIAALYYVCHDTRRMIRDSESSDKRRMYAYIEGRGIVYDRKLKLAFQPCGNVPVSYTHLTLPTKRIV